MSYLPSHQIVYLKISRWHVPKFANGLFNIKKDYQICIGFISKINRNTFIIARHDKTGIVYRTTININDLDYTYCWLQKMVLGNEYQICFRYHTEERRTIYKQSNIKFSDIRLCGVCTRISNYNSVNPYGFIKHALFKNNLYFRITDIDRSPYVKDNTNSILVGDWVAFRVGSQSKSVNRRYWAMRICKL